ncbi:MAG: hypothetical protein M1819_004369 [Sarea resinae]|nr:MAG: hypothetical protein M1819_004369 [Sarea resinae]
MSFKVATTGAEARKSKGSWIIPAHLSPKKQAENKPFRFLDLPAELRIKIYEYVFPPQAIEIVRRKGGRGITYRVGKAGSSPSTSTSSTNGKDDANNGNGKRSKNPSVVTAATSTSQSTPTKSKKPKGRPNTRSFRSDNVSAHLALVSRQLYNETTPLLYNNATFSFGSPYALRHFIGRLQPRTRAQVHHVSIAAAAYGEPNRTADRRWKARADYAWLVACQTAGDALAQLRSLHLALHLSDWQQLCRIRADGHARSQAWMALFWAFGGLDGVLARVRVEFTLPAWWALAAAEEPVLVGVVSEIESRLLYGDGEADLDLMDELDLGVGALWRE